MNLNKKLGIWGKDKIIRKDEKFHASDYYCVGCYANNKKDIPAVSFFPVFDPDIPKFPYCADCIKKARINIILNFQDFNKIDNWKK